MITPGAATVAIENIKRTPYTIPTDALEFNGTFAQALLYARPGYALTALHHAEYFHHQIRVAKMFAPEYSQHQAVD